jgi:putative FmdB family regulatory protein
MPTYEYRCANGHTFERFQRISDPPLDTCPDCGAAAERVLSGGGGLLFKGSGFYITDYRSDKYRKAAESDSSGGKPASEKRAESGKSAEGGKSADGGKSAASSTSTGSTSS